MRPLFITTFVAALVVPVTSVPRCVKKKFLHQYLKAPMGSEGRVGSSRLADGGDGGGGGDGGNGGGGGDGGRGGNGGSGDHGGPGWNNAPGKDGTPGTHGPPQPQPEPAPAPEPEAASDSPPTVEESPESPAKSPNSQNLGKPQKSNNANFPPPPGAPPTSKPKEQADLLFSLHNSYRAQHDASHLTWNESLAKTARQWASECKWFHSQWGPGENLATEWGDVGFSLEVMFTRWTVDEEKHYDGDFNSLSGHFSQVVWKDTTSVGCGWVTCPTMMVDEDPATDALYLVCHYWPPGNIIGDFDDNVTL